MDPCPRRAAAHPRRRPEPERRVATPQFAAGLAELAELAQEAVPAIMCSEAVPWRCHRRLITDALIVAGIEVTHLISSTSAAQAELTPFAKVADGGVTYPPA